MDRIKLNSSSISEVGFDSASNTLEVVFADGRLYQYFEVPQHVYDRLIAAASAGQYFHQEIRGVYRFARA